MVERDIRPAELIMYMDKHIILANGYFKSASEFENPQDQLPFMRFY